MEDVTEGNIRIGERVVNTVPAKDRDIAMVFQNYALYPHMSVYDNMAFALTLRKVDKSEIDRPVRQAGATLGLEDFLERKPRALSGGQNAWPSVRDDALGQVPEEQQETFDAIQEALQNGWYRPNVAYWGDVDEAINQAIQQIVVDGQAVQSTLDGLHD